VGSLMRGLSQRRTSHEKPETINQGQHWPLRPGGCRLRKTNMRTVAKITLMAAALALAPGLRADEVTDWNRYMLHAALVANTSPLVTTRVGALVQSAVFDSFNGIERRYTPIHVTADAPRGASRRAAVVEAAYTMLVHLFPAQKGDLDAKLADSLAGLNGDGDNNDQSVSRGIAWGKSVADAIWTWRSTDGFMPNLPPFTGGGATGEWRPTPPAFLPGALPQFATMTPWVIETQSQFRPSGPPDLSRRAGPMYSTKSKLWEGLRAPLGPMIRLCSQDSGTLPL
jgi:hypothetical protein